MNTQLLWFRQLMDPKTRAMVPMALPAARPESMAAAKNLPFFIVVETGRDEQSERLDQMAVRDGYQSAKFKYVKAVPIATEKRNHWSAYTPDWFEQGIAYLDEISAKGGGAAPPHATASSTTKPAASAAGSSETRTSAAPASKEDQAAHALSLAKSYVSSGGYATARTKLQKIVDDYPGTKAAGEAKKILDEIKDK